VCAPRRLVPLAIALFAFAAAWAPASADARRADRRWSKVQTPAPGPSQAIGNYSNGCLRGARPLEKRGKGFRVMRPQRHRHFGHRQTLAVIRDLGRAARKRRLPTIGVGDLSQPRGGPARGGHASHQVGLDADIWYAIDPAATEPAPLAMVDETGLLITAAWGPDQVQLVQLAARDRRIDRIFVNPVVKRALCESATGDRSWLRKVRPFWGHDHHFHIRLACPAGNRRCKPQEPLPPGDACDEAARWLSPDAQTELAERREVYRSRIGTQPDLPSTCKRLLGPPRSARPPATRSARGSDRAVSRRKR
jgi:penicillin-insensitive murein DD-endopeptidase